MRNPVLHHALISLLAVLGLAASSPAAVCRPLPELDSDQGWRSQTKAVKVSREGASVAFTFTATRSDGELRVLLADPVRLNAGEYLVFEGGMSRICPMLMQALVTDADGHEYAFKTRSLATLPNGFDGQWGSNFIGGVFRGGLDELGCVRMDVPGLHEPVRGSFRPDGRPRGPLQFRGFSFLIEERTHAAPATVWVSSFRVTDADFRNTGFEAVFKDVHWYGEPDGAPNLRLTDFGPVIGERHELDWSIRQVYDGTPFTNGVLRVETLSNDQRPYKLRFDREVTLPRLAAGTYWVKATRRTDFANGRFGSEKTIDFRYDIFRNGTRNVTAGLPPLKVSFPKAGAFKVPRGVPSADDILTGPEPLRIFCPMVRDDVDEFEIYRNLFDEMEKEGKVKTVEIQNRWYRCEPAPGKYDFSSTLKILDEAKRRGFRCFVTFAPLIPPEWMPSIFTMNAEGNRFGHDQYLFHGGRFNLFFSPYARKAALAYLQNLVLAVRNHPATIGYFYITEHSCEAPWADWYEGFDPDTLRHFRKAMRIVFKENLAKANAAWGTSFASFDEIRPPAHGERASMAFRHDWLSWRRNAIHDFVVRSLKTMRELDPHRILMVYGDGLLMHRLGDIAPLKCISANGGCAVPSRFLFYTVWADAGVPMRTEEISCTRWNSFPYQLDRSFFTILGGGGASSHVKMFLPYNAKFDQLRGGENALDRFERFLPLWQEVRGAEAVGRDVCVWSSTEGAYVRADCVNCHGPQTEGWEALDVMDAQIPARLNISTNWTSAKFVFVAPGETVVSAREANALVAYVRNGGHLFMTADAGRKVIERESEDWSLLRAFGFDPPEHLVRNVSLDGDLPLEGRDVGKGRVTVLKGSFLVPPGNDVRTRRMPHFLRRLVRDAGVELRVETDDRSLAVNLMKKGTDVWYLLICGRDRVPVTGGRVRISLPEGNYRVEQMLGDTAFATGTMTALELKSEGVPGDLLPNEVRMWRMTATGK